MAFIISMSDIASQMHTGIWSLNIHLEIWGWNEDTNLILNKYVIFAYYFKSSKLLSLVIINHKIHISLYQNNILLWSTSSNAMCLETEA